MVHKLSWEVEEEAGEIWEYLEGLPLDLSEEQHIEAADASVKKIEDEATVVKDIPSTRSQRGIIERDS